MEAEPKITNKWELNEVALNKLLLALSTDRNEAGELYLILCNNLLRYFEVRGIANSPAAVDEVVNRLARKLESGAEIENVNTYSIGIARLLTLELRKSPEQKTSNELPEISTSPAEEETEGDRKLACLQKCLNELADEKKNLIKGYYQGERREKIENRKS